jgi:hypothetical protein
MKTAITNTGLGLLGLLYITMQLHFELTKLLDDSLPTLSQIPYVLYAYKI